MDKRSFVGNAADGRQVEEARRKEKDKRKGEIEDLKVVLASKQGRRVLWRVLKHCKVFESIWDASSRIHHNAGRQDTGHFIMAEICSADEESLFTMMREAKEADDGDYRDV